ncbi:DUF2975 domain-containing protein [Sporolactobacillus spathodeae]|uniref:DUF2975 domain-containing protein n=1 Tax=Sporolactobacillus spathodeae TaxID=1465502 RepID=A0ABS2Q5G7_9BACL|nr:DUF2975 domain-containing protein [Sporolactobacillus spathodeae]MBM7657023.1 hypothetical protein [Sporolactobacillus spathodeae]
MLILDQKGLSGWVKLLLDLIFIGGALIFLSLPWSVNWYERLLPEESNENYWFLLIFLYVTGFFALEIVFELRRIFNTLNKHDPFLIENVRSLQHMAVASFLITAGYIVKIIFFNSFLTIIIAMVFVIAGLFSLVLSEVFHQAVMVKEENDLTI